MDAIFSNLMLGFDVALTPTNIMWVFIGGLLGKVLGGAGRAIGSQATGSAFSFATTWAIGKVAQQYYGGGRTLDTAALKQSFAGLFEQAKTLQARYAPEITQRAKTLDLGRLTAELRAS